MICLADMDGSPLVDFDERFWAPMNSTVESMTRSAQVDAQIINDDHEAWDLRISVLWATWSPGVGWGAPWVDAPSVRVGETARPLRADLLIGTGAPLTWRNRSVYVHASPFSRVPVSFATVINEDVSGDMSPFRLAVEFLNRPIVPLEEVPVALDPHAVPAAPITASVTVGDEVTREVADSFAASSRDTATISACPTCGSFQVTTTRATAGIRSVVQDPNRITAIVCGICGFEVREDDKGRLTARRRGQA